MKNILNNYLSSIVTKRFLKSISSICFLYSEYQENVEKTNSNYFFFFFCSN